MTWKPEFDSTAETCRPRLWLDAATVAGVRAIGQPGETDDAVIQRLCRMHQTLKRITGNRLTSRQAARLLERLRDEIHQ